MRDRARWLFAETPYAFKTHFENEKGTYREELIAANMPDVSPRR